MKPVDLRLGRNAWTIEKGERKQYAATPEPISGQPVPTGPQTSKTVHGYKAFTGGHVPTQGGGVLPLFHGKYATPKPGGPLNPTAKPTAPKPTTTGAASLTGHKIQVPQMDKIQSQSAFNKLYRKP